MIPASNAAVAWAERSAEPIPIIGAKNSPTEPFDDSLRATRTLTALNRFGLPKSRGTLASCGSAR